MTEETLFHEALSKPPEERAAFLDQACAKQPELRAAVEALLAAHQISGDILARPPEGLGQTVDSEPVHEATGEYTPEPEGAHHPPPATTAAYVMSSEPGVLIAGRYLLEKKIGEGGMGEVWVARQTEPVKRKVAIKLIKTGMDSKAVLARFEQERQALALMDHPNIAKVLDGGVVGPTPTCAVEGQPQVPQSLPDVRLGSPFFVMELVNGLPLNKYCDDAKLTPRERLELFIPICQAVQHAHQKGIVHRDLKPANILVATIDGKPVPKVIDFGVAKATAGKLIDQSMSTQFGAVVGTLEYMSPEQAGFSGDDVDTRADVYSLGVILYELLTGLRPIEAKRLRKAAINEMIRIIREEEPSRPSTRLSTDESLPSLAAIRQTEPKRLMAMLRGELDWVVMKCLEKHRDRRYETASGLARDIERYLANEPIEARPPSFSYRASKFLRRHQGAVAAFGLVLLSLILGIIGTTLGLIQAQTQTELARNETKAKEEALRSEEIQRNLAEQANQQAYSALKSFTDELMEKVLGGRGQLTEDEKSVLRSAQKQWEVFAQTQGDSERARVIRSDGAENLALIQNRLGLTAEAETNHRLSLDTRTELVQAFPNVPRHRMVWARSHQNLGSCLRGAGKSGEAEALFRQAIAIFEQLIADHPEEPEYQSRFAASQISLGNARRDRGDFAATEEHYKTALSAFDRLVARHPLVQDYRRSLAHANWGLAFLKKRTQNIKESEGYYRRAIELIDELAARPDASIMHLEDSGGLHRELGNLLSDAGNPAASIPDYSRSIEIHQQLTDTFPSIPSYRLALARSQRDLGRAFGRLERPVDAEKQLGESERNLEKLVREHPKIRPYQSDLGLAYQYHGEMMANSDPAKSLEWFNQSIRIIAVLYEQAPNEVLTKGTLARSYAGRAALMQKQGRIAEAIEDLRLALRITPQDRTEDIAKWQKELDLCKAKSEKKE